MKQHIRSISPLGASRFERPYTPSTHMTSPSSATSDFSLHGRHGHKTSLSAWSSSDSNDHASRAYSTPNSSIYQTPISPTFRTSLKGIDEPVETQDSEQIERIAHRDDSGAINIDLDREHEQNIASTNQVRQQVIHHQQHSHDHGKLNLSRVERIDGTDVDMHVMDPDEWYARLDNVQQLADNHFGDECPDLATLATVYDIPIYDGEGQEHTFGSLYDPATSINQRQLVVFIRHFYCGACQAYVKALSESITLPDYFSIPIPTSIIIIGCGSPSLIPFYRAVTGSKFHIFAEPSRLLYKRLGMLLSANPGMQRPQYMRDISAPAWFAGQVNTIRQGLRARSETRRITSLGTSFELVRRNTLKPRGFYDRIASSNRHDPPRMSQGEIDTDKTKSINNPPSFEQASQDTLVPLDQSQSDPHKSIRLARTGSIRRRDVVKGGNPFQIGGEFLFEDGQVIWCHRMRHYRNHVEIPDLRKLLDLDD